MNKKSIQSDNQSKFANFPGRAQCTLPVFIRLPKPGTFCSLTGLSRSKIFELISGANPAVFSVVLGGGNGRRGTRLVSVESLLSHIVSTGQLCGEVPESLRRFTPQAQLEQKLEKFRRIYSEALGRPFHPGETPFEVAFGELGEPDDEELRLDCIEASGECDRIRTAGFAG